jgi:transposase-like protein
MIQIIITKHCPECDSLNIVKNGKDYKGDPKFYCPDGGAYGTLDATGRYTPERKEEILRAYQERPSMRGISRIFGVARQTLAGWLKQKAKTLPKMPDTLAPVRPGDVLELDELWSFVYSKDNQRWVWIALCRRTRQIVAFFVGDRSEASAASYWTGSPKLTEAATPLAISGTPTRRSLRPVNITPSAKTVARRPMSSDGT